MFEHDALYNLSSRMELEMALLKIPNEDIVKTQHHLFAYDQTKDTTDLSDEDELTYDEPNCMIDGHAYVAARLSGDLCARREALAYKEISKEIDDEMRSIWGLFLAGMGSIVFLMPLIMILSTCLETWVSPMTVFRALMEQCNENANIIKAFAVFHIIGGVIILGGILIMILARLKERKAEKAPESVNVKLAKKREKLRQLIDDDLGIPKDAEVLEILPYNYKIIGGETKEYLSNHAYENINTAIWREGEFLCISDHFSTVKMPVTAVKGYTTVKEKCRISDWWKDDPHNSSTYAPYRIIEEKSGCYLMDSHIRVTVDVPEGEETRSYLLRIPTYELPILRKFISPPCLDENGKEA